MNENTRVKLLKCLAGRQEKEEEEEEGEDVSSLTCWMEISVLM